MPKITTISEDYVRYRDGKKWKRRFCFLSKADSKKRTVTMFITKQFGVTIPNQEIDEKSLKNYIMDEVTGYEHGRHVDKESHVMALIGRSVVYCIAFENTDTMFRWAETLNKLVSSVNFHVTLKKISETSGIFKKLSVGIQGNLHVQLNRLCLIGEPADGNKFLCEWSMENLISVDIYNTLSDKLKKLQIKSNGKIQRGKGYFEFEISLTLNSIFEETFRIFLTACRAINPEFKTNIILKTDSSVIFKGDNYSVENKNKNFSNNENSSTIKKRSSEILIPRSRENSGPDQKSMENLKIKMRKPPKNLQKFSNEHYKHYSINETIGKNNEYDSCVFADDEEIDDQVHHKSQNPFNILNKENSDIFVHGVSDFIPESNSNFLNNILEYSTYKPLDEIIDNVPPPCQKIYNPQTNIFLKVYRYIIQNPLSLKNYSNYYNLLATILSKKWRNIARSSSFNCVNCSEIRKFEDYKNYSNTNVRLNVVSQASENHFKTWKNKLDCTSIEDFFLKMQNEQNKYENNADLSKHLLSNRLPFRSLKDFNYSMKRSLQSGNICFSLFSYHHFILLLKDVKNIVKSINSKVTSIEAETEYRNWKNKIYGKNKVYKRWLEKSQPFNSSCDNNDRLTEPSILDINILFVFEIIDHLIDSRYCVDKDLGGVKSRSKSYLDTNPTLELHYNKLHLVDNIKTHLATNGSSGTKPVLSISCSTPDFRLYNQHERVHKISNMGSRYQNISSINTYDTSNHTFPKQNANINKPQYSNNKGGSYNRLKQKYSHNVFIPFIRRKTSSTRSTLSEPICRNRKEEKSYYNLTNQIDPYNKKSLSVVLDSCYYVNVNQDNKYANIANNLETRESSDISNYININSTLGEEENSLYPDEIIDPSKNYGDLNYIKSRLRYTQSDADNHSWLNLRRSSLSILSKKSLQNLGATRSVSFSKRDLNINQAGSVTCKNNRSSDYINTETLGSSPQSIQSYSSSQATNPCENTVPHSLNYISVIGNSTCNSLSHKFSIPLSIYTQNEARCDHQKLTLLRTPQSSPVVDYCQIDLNCTYALRDIDRMLYEKIKSRSTHTTTSKDGSPDDIESFKSLEQMPDNYSISSSSSAIEKKFNFKDNKKSFRRFFSRKCGSIT